MAYSHRIVKVVIAVAFCVSYVIEGEPNTRFVDETCNGRAFPRGHLFQLNLQWALNQVRDKTAYNKYNYYYHSPWPSKALICYGYGRCNGKIGYEDCTACLRIAVDRMLKDCQRRIGAQLQLVDCRIRYEIYPFTEA